MATRGRDDHPRQQLPPPLGPLHRSNYDSAALCSKGNDLRIYEEVLRDAQVKQRPGASGSWLSSAGGEVDAGGYRRIDKAALDDLKQQLQNVGWDLITNGMLSGGVLRPRRVGTYLRSRIDRHITPQAVKVRNRRQLPLRTAGNPCLADAEQHAFMA
ncbi:hypothetical protein P4050_15965 [Pseudomonas aeruginosa]|nr:hypothetical protein [Pseudomonas aeruginosa]